MVVTLAVPKYLGRFWPIRKGALRQEIGEVSLGIETDTETLHPFDLSILLGLGFGAVWLSNVIAVRADPVPSIIILTFIALLLAQSPAIKRIRSIRVLGMYAVYLFLAVIGAYCDLGAAYRMGELGITLLTFTSVTVLIHGLLIYSLALLFRVDPVIASLASQANIGGGHLSPGDRAKPRPRGSCTALHPYRIAWHCGGHLPRILGLGILDDFYSVTSRGDSETDLETDFDADVETDFDADFDVDPDPDVMLPGE